MANEILNRLLSGCIAQQLRLLHPPSKACRLRFSNSLSLAGFLGRTASRAAPPLAAAACDTADHTLLVLLAPLLLQ
jgi:hypothetical protein